MNLKRISLPFLIWLGLALPALAAAGPWVQDGEVRARLISAIDGVGDLVHLPLGLQVQMNAGWKTYWRSPGEAGLPPALDFTGSTNLGPTALAYPIPQRFSLLGLETFGYEGEVVFPLEAKVENPRAGVNLKAKADLLVCAKICVPHSLALTLALPAGPASVAREAQVLNSFTTKVPNGSQAAGMKVLHVKLMGSGDNSLLEVDAAAPQAFVAPDVFPESQSLSFGHPQVTLTQNGKRAQIRLPVLHVAAGTRPSNADPMTLTLVDGTRFTEARPIVEAAELPSLLQRFLVLAPILGIALLGGFILNFMPCVLPVLSLKLLTVASQGGQERGYVRAGFLASSAGILTSFMVLAGALVWLKSAGQTVGWGIQFQQPLFLVALVLMLTLFACNLWGFFEINLPMFVNQRLGKAGESSLAGHFSSGAFATLLATPCSAPFLGTAVGFALASGPVEIFAVFIALGLGLALPFLVVAAWPGIATHLPKPGLWMVRLRQLLGFALAATAIWLLYVAHVQIGDTRTWVVALAVVALVAGCALLRKRLVMALGLGLLSVSIALAATNMVAVRGESVNPTRDLIRWTAFDEAQIKNLVSQGQVVFVDITADWCLTCQANRRVVLDNARVVQELNGAGITNMKADWTKPNANIAHFLAQHGRYGIPFNIIYGPAMPSGIALPELLTNEAVLRALKQAQR